MDSSQASENDHNEERDQQNESPAQTPVGGNEDGFVRDDISQQAASSLTRYANNPSAPNSLTEWTSTSVEHHAMPDSAMLQGAEHQSRSPAPRTARTSSNRPPLPRTQQTFSEIRIDHPRIAITDPAALVVEDERTHQVQLEQQRLAEASTVYMDTVIADLRSFTINSDPEWSGTLTTLALRLERLSQDCSIGCEAIAVPVETCCGHIFEAECLLRAWMSNAVCPLCRTPLVPWSTPSRHASMHLLIGDQKKERNGEGKSVEKGEKVEGTGRVEFST